MAAWTYDASLKQLLAHEGGYSNHPSDPGGPTNYGITIADYRKYVMPNATAADVRAMKLDDAKAIYRQRYWEALRCDDLPAGVDYAIFDYGVNSGVGRAGRVLRRTLGLDDRTHAVTEPVLAAARASGAKELVVAICNERLRFLKGLKTWPVFGRGWARRVAEVESAALAMAGGKDRPIAGAPGRNVGKGIVELRSGAQRASAGVVVATGAAAAEQAHHGGARLGTLLVVAAVAAAAAVLAWTFWRWRQRRQQHARA